MKEWWRETSPLSSRVGEEGGQAEDGGCERLENLGQRHRILLTLTSFEPLRAYHRINNPSC